MEMDGTDGAAINLVGNTVQFVSYGPQVKPVGPTAHMFRTRDGLPAALVTMTWDTEDQASKVANILFDGLDEYAAERHIPYALTMVGVGLSVDAALKIMNNFGLVWSRGYETWAILHEVNTDGSDQWAVIGFTDDTDGESSRRTVALSDLSTQPV